MDLNSISSFQNIFTKGSWNRQDKFSDAFLRTEDDCEFRVHRIILSHRSRYFCCLFTHTSFEQDEGICLKGIDGSILDKILLYVYSGDTSFNKNNVWDVLIAADYFLLDDLVDKCWSIALQHFNNETCLTALTTAYHVQRLLKTKEYHQCYRYTIVHFKELNTVYIGNLPLTTLKIILNDNSLNVNSEETVWEAIVNWIEFHQSERLKHVKDLASCIRLGEEDEELAMKIRRSNLVNNNPYLPDHDFFKKSNYILSDVYNFVRSSCVQFLKGPRLPKLVHFLIVPFLSFNNPERRICLTYDHEVDFWRQISSIPLHVNTIVKSGHHIYVFDTLESEFFSYNILSETLVNITPLQTERWNFIPIGVGGKVFLVGGSDDFGVENIGCYDPALELWSTIDFPELMTVSAAVELNGCIYIFGDEEGSEAVVCQVYGIANSLWSSISPPPVMRAGASAVVHNGNIYVYGGTEEQQTVEEYNPARGTWKLLPPLPFNVCHDVLKAITLGDNLVMCDAVGTSRFVQWDSSCDKWIDIEATESLQNMRRFDFCSVDDRELIEDLTRKNRRIGNQWERKKE